MTRGRTLVCHSCDKCTNSLFSQQPVHDPEQIHWVSNLSSVSSLTARSSGLNRSHCRPTDFISWIFSPSHPYLFCLVFSFYLNRNLFALFNCFSPQLIIFLSVPLSLSVCLILCPPSRLASLCFCISCVHPQQTRDGPVVSSGETLTSDDLLAKVIPPQQTQSKHDL